MKHKVVACIPTQNTAWLQQYTLKHLSKFCHKIIVSDDNSSDNTYDVCSSFDKVEYFRRPVRDPRDRQGALQRQELLEKAYQYDPDYFFFLDADEMPSPDIIKFIDSLDVRENEKTNCWTFPWVHLWTDASHYRVDSYISKLGHKHVWDPFAGGQRKSFLVRNIPGYELKYDILQHRVRPSNGPVNVPLPIKDVENSPVIIHYGKISEYFLSEQNWKDRGEWDKYSRNADPKATLNHHRLSNATDTLKLREVKEEWFWE